LERKHEGRRTLGRPWRKEIILKWVLKNRMAKCRLNSSSSE
jgi:hypothetical protein